MMTKPDTGIDRIPRGTWNSQRPFLNASFQPTSAQSLENYFLLLVVIENNLRERAILKGEITKVCWNCVFDV